MPVTVMMCDACEVDYANRFAAVRDDDDGDAG